MHEKTIKIGLSGPHLSKWDLLSMLEYLGFVMGVRDTAATFLFEHLHLVPLPSSSVGVQSNSHSFII